MFNLLCVFYLVTHIATFSKVATFEKKTTAKTPTTENKHLKMPLFKFLKSVLLTDISLLHPLSY